MDKIIKNIEDGIKNGKEKALANSELDDLLCAVQFLLKLLPKWVYETEEGMDPTFYGTGSYEGDLEVFLRVEQIEKMVKELSA